MKKYSVIVAVFCLVVALNSCSKARRCNGDIEGEKVMMKVNGSHQDGCQGYDLESPCGKTYKVWNSELNYDHGERITITFKYVDGDEKDFPARYIYCTRVLPEPDGHIEITEVYN